MLNLEFIPQPQLYRVKHDAELGPLWRVAPEVFPLNGNVTPFTADWQSLTYQMCNGITGPHWRQVYAYNTAFMNNSGFNDAADTRADYVNQMDLSSPLPSWDKCRVCGGAVITGVESGGNLIVSTLDGRNPAPPLSWILRRPWFYVHAVTVYDDGHVGEFPENMPTLVPLVGWGTATISLNNLVKLPMGSPIPSPYYPL